MAKQFTLTETEDFKAKEILTSIIENAPVGQGFTLAQMRKRLRIVDAVRSSEGDTITLEDEDYNGLKDAIESFNGFLGGKQMAALVKMHDEILKAKAPPKPDHLKAV